MKLLSIQSHVTFGHVGNAAAVFPLQRLGCEVWPIHTVQFSNHTGYGAWRGDVFSAESIRALVNGMAERGVLRSCDGILSGYIGSAEIGEAILDAVARVKHVNPRAWYCCDPVIGDADSGVFVQPGIPEFMASRAIPAADLLTPNQFELEHLTGCSAPTLAGAQTAIDHLHALGPRTVLVTSLHSAETPADMIDVLASGPNGQFLVRTPLLPVGINGAGDTIAALFFYHYLLTASAAKALSAAVSATFGVIERTARARSRELLLVEAQDELVAPTRVFPAARIR